jgi:hypothetical protein
MVGEGEKRGKGEGEVTISDEGFPPIVTIKDERLQGVY